MTARWAYTLGLFLHLRKGGHPAGSLGKQSSLRSWREHSSLLSGFKKWVSKHTATQSNSQRCSSTGHSRYLCLHRSETQDDCDKPGPIGTLWGSRLEWAALRRLQQEWLEGNHCETWAMGRKVRPSTSQAQPLEQKKLWYTCRPFGMNSLMEGTM